MAASDQASGGGDAGTARTGEAFTWDPGAAGLDGEPFTADAIRFADYDLIVQDPGGAAFTEAGYLPIAGFSLGGEPVAPAGFGDPGGAGWGAYLRITGAGTATATPYGTPGAAYDRLAYEIVGFNGAATYCFDADGNVAVDGAAGDAVTLLAGSLLSGAIAFVPTAPDELTIQGAVYSTVDAVAPGFAAGRLDVLVLGILHPPADYAFVSPTTTRVAAPSGTDGVFLDWDAIAAQVTRNFEETGQWFY